MKCTAVVRCENENSSSNTNLNCILRNKTRIALKIIKKSVAKETERDQLQFLQYTLRFNITKSFLHQYL